MGGILLVEPDFPIPSKSKNHKNFLPIGLLKIGSYLRSRGIQVRLVRGYPNKDIILQTEIAKFDPDEVWITSLFTYWSKYVKEATQYYKSLFANARIVVGGIYASLMPEQCKEYTGCHEVYQGVMNQAENYAPAYDLIKNVNPQPINYQIIHASRGCMRNCPFCGAWKIEPKFEPKESIKKEISSRRIVFYDNNFLYNPYIDNILEELTTLKRTGLLDWCESQSGFDGRVLAEKPYLAKKIKGAGFRDPRIAWDWGYDQAGSIKAQLDLFVSAGYSPRDIYIFMLYNWDISFEEMEMKRKKCWEWKVQIADCRFRPLGQTYDNYDPRGTRQTSAEYHIHEESDWTDALVRKFRSNIRKQNICVRQELPFYSKKLEAKTVERDIARNIKAIPALEDKLAYLDNAEIDYWVPNS